MEQPVPDDEAVQPVVPSRLFTPRKRAVFLDAMKKGQTVKAAAARAGTTHQTIYDTMARDLTFAAQVERARGEAEARLVDAVTKSAHTGETVTTPGGQVTVRPGDWRAAAWLLEHHPHTRERYAPISKAQIGGDPDNPTPVKVETDGVDILSSVERLGAVVTVLQRAGVMPIPSPGDGPVVLVLPEPDGATERPMEDESGPDGRNGH